MINVTMIIMFAIQSPGENIKTAIQSIRQVIKGDTTRASLSFELVVFALVIINQTNKLCLAA